ncbi:MAG: putative transport system ATP-binding protein [Clostridiales bacterium]|jgi:putative ABC transport system ATP-binding protein|nr:putative transport system ATP-binding protein [Clostridiales bacterium]MDN5298298.1 putative transport system ATP-binding protein [Clostridiales bacterium]
MTKHSEVVISVKGLRKVYRIGNEKVVALRQIDLDIHRGEICCILGTSGSGKSTLLNMMAGLEKPSKGTILIKGEAIEKMNEKQLAKFRQRNIGFIFQSYNLLSALTAIENVAMPLIFRGMPKALREKRAKKYLKMVGLGDRYHHKPTQMSGGQQQRVGIARAFVGTPEIVFADEPTGNLDTKTSIEVMHIMWRMAREKDQTIVIVTHDPEVALYADKVVNIRDGDIQSVEDRPEDDVYEKFIKPYEESFITADDITEAASAAL